MKDLFFTPLLERLEGRFLLASLPAMSDALAESHLAAPGSTVFPAEMGLEAPGETAVQLDFLIVEDVTLMLEHSGTGTVLHLQFHGVDWPRVVGIARGQLELVQADGTAELTLPPDTHLIELVIATEGASMVEPFLRIELDPWSGIARAQRLSAAMLTKPDDGMSPVMGAGGMMAIMGANTMEMHGADLHAGSDTGSPRSSGFGGTHMPGMGTGDASEADMDAVHGHGGSRPLMNSSLPGALALSGAAAGFASPASSPPIHGGAGRHANDMTPVSAAPLHEDEMPSEEALTDALFASWSEDEDSEADSGLVVLSCVSAAGQVRLVSLTTAEPSLETTIFAANQIAPNTAVLSESPASTTQWQVAVAAVIAASSAAGAYLLDRQARRALRQADSPARLATRLIT
ncbi:MAG: hypothetical protein ACKVP0_07490 [Pirellulaceae bacterium]